MSLLHTRRKFICVACACLLSWLMKEGDSPPYAQEREDAEASYFYDPAGKRDPFMSPFYTPPEDIVPEEAKTPLQRFDLGQLKLVGIIWEADEPKALIEDGGGLGYIVTRGTFIGSKGGIVRAIEPRRIVVEEYETDFAGKRRAHQRELPLSVIEAERDTQTKDR
jgi:type IV pilus assembly protein PilP